MRQSRSINNFVAKFVDFVKMQNNIAEMNRERKESYSTETLLVTRGLGGRKGK